MHNAVGRSNNTRGEAFLNCANSHPCKITLFVISIIAFSCAVTAFVLASHFTSPLLTEILIDTGIGLAVAGLVLPIFILTRRAIEFSRQSDFYHNIGGRHPVNEQDHLEGLDPNVEQVYRYSEDERKFHIDVVQRDIQVNPAWHLAQLASMIAIQIGQRADPSLKVHFHNQLGEDAGGLTKVYLDDLMKAFVSNGELFTINPLSLYGMPKSRSPADDLIFRQLGQLMMFCYPKLPLGRYIDPLVFEMALSMPADEIDTEYNQFAQRRKLDLFKFIVESRIDPEIAARNRLLNRDQQTLDVDQKMLDLLGKDRPEDWTNEECITVGTIVSLPEGYCDEYQDPIPEVVINPQNRPVLVNALWTFYENRLGPELRAIRAMAEGMKSICAKGNEQAYENAPNNAKWNATFALNEAITPVVFCEKIQGKIDRDYIARHIIYDGNNAEIRKKTRWLQEWVLGNGEESIIIIRRAGQQRGEERRVVLKATDQELREVLKFITGSTCLPEGRDPNVNRINIGALQEVPHNQRSPYPKTHTCFNRIEFPQRPTSIRADNDLTKAAFIQTLLHAVTNSGGRVDNW